MQDQSQMQLQLSLPFSRVIGQNVLMANPIL